MGDQQPTKPESRTDLLIKTLIHNGEVNTVYARDELGISDPVQRMSELINKKQMPIGKGRITVTDSKGIKRCNVRNYIWLGEKAKQPDFFGYPAND